MMEFNIMESILKMAEVVVAVEHEAHKALEAAARVVEHEAKEEIGHYQDAVGPFAQWAELADSTKDQRVRMGFSENDPLLRTGELRDSIGHEVDGRNAVVGSTSDIAVYQELGTARIPPRSFLGGAAARKESDVVDIIGEGAVIGLVGQDVFRRYLPIRS